MKSYGSDLYINEKVSEQHTFYSLLTAIEIVYYAVVYNILTID